MLDLDTLNFEKGNGLVTVVTVDAASGAVLMVAHADRAALERTVASGEMHYRSRTRGLWHKGATSGNVQRVVALTADCDGDAVLARVIPAGPACHTGTVSCFGSDAVASGARALEPFALLDATIASRAGGSAVARGQGGGADAAGAPTNALRPSYTRRLLDDRNLRLKKLGEEATELAIACADEDRERAVEEAADLIYHALVALRPLGLSLDDVARVLATRSGR